MLAKPVLACVIFLAIPVCAQNTPPAKPTTPPAKAVSVPAKSVPKPEMATWTEASESIFSISKDEFSAMGFSKLTDDEYAALLFWIAERDKKVAGDAGTTARAQTLTYSCGRDVKQADEYDRVNIYLDIPNDTPSELASRIRQNFRAMKDVQVVFSSKEADLKIWVVAYELATAVGHNVTGYAANVTITAPCTSKIGTYESAFETLSGSWLQTGGTDASQLAEVITTAIDAHQIESQRKSNAALKQMMQTK